MHARQLRPHFFAIVAWLVALAVPTDAKGKRVALLIGNSAYQHTSALSNPRHDAADLAKILSSLGFEVIEGYDLDKAALDGKVRAFADALDGASVGLFFYAGHGLQVSGENYLVPVDAKLGSAAALDFEMVRLSFIQRVMERATETNIIFLDACRDNPLARNLARAMGTRSAAIGRGLAPVESGAGTLISFSTQPGNVALDGRGRNSPFAAALVEELAASRDDISTVLIGVRNRVMAATSDRQVPWEHSALRARLYLQRSEPAGPASADAGKLGEAAQAWSVTKDSTSAAVLRAYAQRYDGTVFSELARARLGELERMPSDAPQSSMQSEPRQSTDHPFDGVWVGTFTGGPGCPVKSGQAKLVIENSLLETWGGSVSAAGELSFSRPAQRNPRIKVRHSVRLVGDKGSGTYTTTGSGCRGTTEFRRLGAVDNG